MVRHTPSRLLCFGALFALCLLRCNSAAAQAIGNGLNGVEGQAISASTGTPYYTDTMWADSTYLRWMLANHGSSSPLPVATFPCTHQGCIVYAGTPQNPSGTGYYTETPLNLSATQGVPLLTGSTAPQWASFSLGSITGLTNSTGTTLATSTGSLTSGDCASIVNSSSDYGDSGVNCSNVATNSTSGTTNAVVKWSGAHALTNATMSDTGSRFEPKENTDIQSNPISEEATTAATTYNVGNLAVYTASNTVGDSTSVAQNLQTIGVVLAKNGSAPNWAKLGQVSVNSAAASIFTEGDFVCSDSANAAKVIDNGTTPCPPNSLQIGTVVATDGSSTTSHNVDLQIGRVAPLSNASGTILATANANLTSSASGDVISVDASGNAQDSAVAVLNVVTAGSSLTNNYPVVGNGSKGLSTNQSPTMASPTMTTQSVGDNSTKGATTAYVRSEILMTWSCHVSSATSSVATSCQWTLPAAVTFTQFDIHVVTAAATCSTSPVLALYDSTGSTTIYSFTLSNATNSFAVTTGTVSVASGHVIVLKTTTAGSGCGTNAAGIDGTATYQMQS